MEALLWGLVAGSAFVVGGLLALRVHLPPLAVGLLMGFGAGALIASVAFELVEEAGLLPTGEGHVAFGLLVGNGLYLFATGFWSREHHESHVSTRALTASVIPEGIVIVGSLLVGHNIDVAMIASVFLCGVPCAFVATGHLVADGEGPRTIMARWVGLAVICGVSAGVVHMLLNDAAAGRLAFVLAAAGGAVLTELTTELVPEGHRLAGPIVGTAVVIGFAIVFALVEVA